MASCVTQRLFKWQNKLSADDDEMYFFFRVWNGKSAHQFINERRIEYSLCIRE